MTQGGARDGLIAILAILGLTIPFALAGLWWWVRLIISISVVVAIWEGLAVLQTGHTLSQQFWQLRKTRPVIAWGLIALLAVMWAGLLIHLCWRVL